jgi:type IV fimbrial biogenesis protein FimT
VLEMKKASRPSARGFTLIELVVTVAIVAVAMMVAVPSLTTFQRNAELASTINTLLAAANSARGEALKRGREAMVVPIDGANWSSGLRVFVDINRTRSYVAADDILIYESAPLPTYLTVVTAESSGPIIDASPYILFDASGFPKTRANTSGNLTMSIVRSDASTADRPSQTRRLIVSRSGRTRTCKPTSAADPLCESSNTE